MSPRFHVKVLKPFKALYKGRLKGYRELIYYGGRGGGKTKQLVQYCFLQALEKKRYILCLRKYEKSQKYSLLTEFKELIRELRLQYEERETTLRSESLLDEVLQVKIREITFSNGSNIIFAGVSDNTVWSLKSFSNVDLAFYDEANEISKLTYEVLKPTIRKEGSQLIFSYNPQNREDFLSVKTEEAIKNPGGYTYVQKVGWRDNALFPPVLNRDRLESLKNDTPEIYAWKWEGAYLEKAGAVVNIENIGFFSGTCKYKKIYATIDTAYSKASHADYSVIAIFGIADGELHLLRVMRGHWEFGELCENLRYAYGWVSQEYKLSMAPIIVEEKSSGISLIQEMRRLTNYNIRSVKPTTDKFSRLSQVLPIMTELRMPADKTGLNSWVDLALAELKAFRPDLKHANDDIVDCIVYGLDFYKLHGKIPKYSDLVKRLKL